MKQWACGVLAAALLLGTSGCAQTPSEDPVQETPAGGTAGLFVMGT